ncbi:MAG: MopE-related protein, partial [Myxococcales bacterium]
CGLGCRACPAVANARVACEEGQCVRRCEPGFLDCGSAGCVAHAEHTYFGDRDGDGFGRGTGYVKCQPEPQDATRAGDCEDADPEIAPGAAERCNGLDDDCDGDIDGGELCPDRMHCAGPLGCVESFDPPPDGGAPGDAGNDARAPPDVTGCGCGAGGAAPLLALPVLGALTRRRRVNPHAR